MVIIVLIVNNIYIAGRRNPQMNYTDLFYMFILAERQEIFL